MQILSSDVILCLVSALLVDYYIARRQRRGMESLYNALVIALMLAMVVVFSLTGVSPISGFHTDIRPAEINYVPFVGMAAVLREGISWYSVSNILGNVLLFVPLGLLAPIVSPGVRKLWKTALLGFCVSLWIECTQLFLSRGTDVDDLILNTLGTALGYALYAAARRIFPKMAADLDAQADAVYGKRMLALCILLPYAVIVAHGFYDRHCYFR